MEFEKALEQLLKHEGGYSNNPSDTGGETYKGISRVHYPKFTGWSIIDAAQNKAMLLENKELDTLVADFYYSYYWYKLKADDIRNPFIAKMLFNFSINMGKKQVIKKVQRILNVPVDGLIGNITIAALNEMDPKAFTFNFLLEIVEFYVQISKNGNNKVFLLGWLNRAMSVYYDALQYFK